MYLAEQTLTALRAASVSISRWERRTDHLRTLINVGLMQPDEKRWPTADLYPIADDPAVIEQMDVDTSGRDGVLLYRVRNAKAADLAKSLTSLFQNAQTTATSGTGAAGARSRRICIAA